MLVTLGLISVEICTGTGDPTAPVPKSWMDSILLLPSFCFWGGRGWRRATALLSTYKPPQGLLPWAQGRGAPAWTSEEPLKAATCPVCSVARAEAETLLRSRAGQEPRCSSSSSCFEAVGAGSLSHTRPTVPR